MVEALKHLLALTAQARDSAKSGNFQALEVLIDKRGEVLEQLSSRQKTICNDTQKVLAREVSLCITQLDEEIGELVKEEMDRENRDMLEISNKLRVLAAYSKGLPANRLFDRIL